MEASILGISESSAVSLPLHTCHDLSDEDEINDQRCSQERVFTNVEQADGLMTIQEDLGIVLIKGTLVVANSGHVLDDDAMVWVLAVLVKNVVGGDHVIDDIGLGDFLGAELLL